MKRKIFSLLLIAAMLLSLCGCNDTVSQIADSVVDAAVEELKTQVTRVLEENKLEVVELKTAFGKLNDEGGEYQLFIAALVKSDATAIPQSTADTLGKLFSDAGLLTQTGSTVESEHLKHKEITFNHSDFTSGNYYVIYGYAADLTANMPSIN